MRRMKSFVERLNKEMQFGVEYENWRLKLKNCEEDVRKERDINVKTEFEIEEKNTSNMALIRYYD